MEDLSYQSPPKPLGPGLATLDAGTVRAQLKAGAPAFKPSSMAASYPFAAPQGQQLQQPPSPPASPDPEADLMRSLTLGDLALPASPASSTDAPSAPAGPGVAPPAGATPRCSEACAPMSCPSEPASLPTATCSPASSLGSGPPTALQLQAMLHAQQEQMERQEQRTAAAAALQLQQAVSAAAQQQHAVLPAATAQQLFFAATGSGAAKSLGCAFQPATPAAGNSWPSVHQQQQADALLSPTALAASYTPTADLAGLPRNPPSAASVFSAGCAASAGASMPATPFQPTIWGGALPLPPLDAQAYPSLQPQQAAAAAPACSTLPQALLQQLPAHLQLQVLLQQQQLQQLEQLEQLRQQQQHQSQWRQGQQQGACWQQQQPQPQHSRQHSQQLQVHHHDACFPSHHHHQQQHYQLQQEAGYSARQLAQQAEQDPPETLLGIEGRYQPYCQQVITPRLNEAAVRALTAVKLLQASDDPATSLVAGKRFFCSLKEVTKVVPSARCLLVAPDVRVSPTAHINPVAALQRILRSAEAAGVPVIFALSRRGIGQVFGRDKSMSIVAIMNLDGLEEPFVAMMEEGLKGRQLYEQHRARRGSGGGAAAMGNPAAAFSARCGGGGAAGAFAAAATVLLQQSLSAGLPAGLGLM